MACKDPSWDIDLASECDVRLWRDRLSLMPFGVFFEEANTGIDGKGGANRDKCGESCRFPPTLTMVTPEDVWFTVCCSLKSNHKLNTNYIKWMSHKIFSKHKSITQFKYLTNTQQNFLH